MRGPFDVCECVGHTYLSGTLFGMQVCARDELALRNGMLDLAELIDTTCYVESVDSTGRLLAYRLSCGDTAYVAHPALRPSYCPSCGARVVNEDAD